MQWPDYFPDGCPPQDAQPATGEVYRLVKKNPPESKDFIPTRKKQPSKDFGEKECEACGLSVLRNVEDAVRVKSRAPGMKKRLVAKGTLNPHLGRIKRTPSKKFGQVHHTWWAPTDIQPWSVFRIIEIPQEG